MNYEGESLARPILDIRSKGETVPFPEDPDARFEGIFSSIGNSEAKCVTLLLLEKKPIGMSDLHREFLYATDDAMPTDTRVQSDYCRNDFAKIGMIAEVDVLYYNSKGYVPGYRIADAGNFWGKPIAAYLLQQSLEFNRPLEKLFAFTSTSGGETRAVLNRTTILQYLYEHSESDHPMTVTQIANDLGSYKELVASHLKRLARLGLAEYSSMMNVKGEIIYTATENAENLPFEKYGSVKTQTNVVRAIALRLGVLDEFAVYDLIKKEHPEIRTDPGHVGRILAHLSRQGILVRRFGKGRSETAITEEGRKLVSRIILPVRKALSPGGEELLDEWGKIPWQDYAIKATRRHGEESSHKQELGTQEGASQVLQMIIGNPGIRPSEIKALLNHLPNDYLRHLLKQGVIRKEKSGNTTRYFAI